MVEQQVKLVVYGTSWCGDTRRSRAYLRRHQIPYEWIDIDQDKAGKSFVQKVNNGMSSVPTIVLPDGSVIVEPTDAQLEERLRPWFGSQIDAL